MFQNLTILEFASVLAGPSVGMFFAELGATVLKVEHPVAGDSTRSWKLGAENAASDVSAYFSSVNWGKQSISIDLGSAEGRAQALALVGRADIVVTSFKSGDDVKFGLDYKSLQAIQPSLIYARVTGFGDDDSRTGYDAIIQAETGFTSINGQPDGPPTKMPVALMDVLAGHQLKEAILIALLRRAATGSGAYLSVSLFEAGVAALVNQAANYLVAGIEPRRMGSDHPNIVPYGSIFATADHKMLVLAVGTDEQFERLCSVLQSPDVARDDRFASNKARVENREALLALLARLFLRFNRSEALAALQRKAVPAGAVNSVSEALAAPAAARMHISGERSGTTIRGTRSIAFQADFLDNTYNPPPPPHLNAHDQESE